jgi:hypothetical protein
VNLLSWLVVILVVVAVVAGAFLVVRRARRAGSVLASRTPDPGVSDPLRPDPGGAGSRLSSPRMSDRSGQ